MRFEDIPDEKQRLADWLNESKIANHDRYNSLLYAHGDFSSSSIKEIAPNMKRPVILWMVELFCEKTLMRY